MEEDGRDEGAGRVLSALAGWLAADEAWRKSGSDADAQTQRYAGDEFCQALVDFRDGVAADEDDQSPVTLRRFAAVRRGTDGVEYIDRLHIGDTAGLVEESLRYNSRNPDVAVRIVSVDIIERDVVKQIKPPCKNCSCCAPQTIDDIVDHMFATRTGRICSCHEHRSSPPRSL